IHNKHWWEKAVDWVADHWDDIVAACKIIVAVLGIVVMIIGGPLAWLVLAAAVIVLADTVMKYLQGKASLWDVLFAALDCIPMFKGLTTAGGLLKMARELPSLIKSGKALENIANSVRKGATALRDTGRDIKKLVTCGDPVDVASGDLVMSATDVELPGVLPLVLERHHRSSFRDGQWFGASWSSTLDQCLLLDDQGVLFTTADGMTLYYPVPEPGVPVMPAEGPRWPLAWDGIPGGAMSVTHPETGQVTHFGPAGGASAVLRLVAVTDRSGNRIDVAYDADGVPSEVAHAGGYRVGVDRAGMRIAGFRLLSHPEQPSLVSYAYDGSGNLAGITNSSGTPLTFRYDDDHRILGWEDRNATWYRYEYDTRGRVVFSTGTERLLEYRYTYDDANRRTTATNSAGHATTYQFNEYSQLVTETDPLGHTTTRTWDRYDRIQSRTDALGQTTRYLYDDEGFPLAVVRPDGSTTRAENGRYGLPVTMTQADGHVWHMEYDDAGNLTGETDPTGARVSYRYTEGGALCAVTDAAGRTARIDTDATGMPVAMTDAEGGTTRFARDAFGRLVAQTGPSGDVTRFTWNTEGRLSERVLPDGSVERRSYDGEGNLVAAQDATGQVTRFEYAGFDKPAARIDPDGSRLEFTYDGELRVTSVTNQLGSSWRYTYDEAGRLIHEEDFTGRAQLYRYDAAGRLVEQVNGAGQATGYVRDVHGKVVEQRTGDSVTTYAYDQLGQVVHVRGRDAELSYERDALGRVLAETCNGATLRTTYDALGRRVRRVTPSGVESVWDYDDRDRPVALRTAGRTVTFGYDAAGREIERRAGAAALAQTWDANGRLSTQTLTAAGLTGSPEPRRVQHRTYRYRSDGVVDAVGDLVAGDRTFDLDSTGRVTGVQAATWTEQYAYDATGNIAQGQWQESRAPQQQPPAGGAPRATTDVHYEYDAQGRVVLRRRKRLSRKADLWRYTWDGEDRLVGVVTPDGTRWAYRYDAYGRRTAKERLAADGETVVETTLFAWDGFVLAEQTTSAPGEAPRCTTWDWEQDRFSP
ncbi:MAG: DUF6531 domain-containing protein, partial [Actinomycetia bacterium]|nr:DUF6531 domain-containing protein [Actinomycetes bacterium]